MTNELRQKIQAFHDKVKELLPEGSKMPSAEILADHFLEGNPDIDYQAISLVRYFHKAKKGKLIKVSYDDVLKQIKENSNRATEAFSTPVIPTRAFIPPSYPKETEQNYYQLKELWDKKLFKVLIFSDPHGYLADLKALRCINKVLQHNRYDEVCINGDIVDMPYISRHTRKLYEDGILKGYSEIEEIRYTREQILEPLRLSTKALIRCKLGNHDERLTKPNLLGEGQMARLAVLYKHCMTTKFEEMLNLDPNNGYIYDPSDVYTYFDKFDVVHGLSLAKNASEKNIQEYMSSGTSGHSHRLNSKYLTNRRAPYVWFESGHTRVGEQVEYLPTGKIADWQQGFIDINFLVEGDKVRFFAQTVNIIEGRCMFNGVVYDGN